MKTKPQTAVIVALLSFLLVATGALANPQANKNAKPPVTHAQDLQGITAARDNTVGVNPAYYQSNNDPFHAD